MYCFWLTCQSITRSVFKSYWCQQSYQEFTLYCTFIWILRGCSGIRIQYWLYTTKYNLVTQHIKQLKDHCRPLLSIKKESMLAFRCYFVCSYCIELYFSVAGCTKIFIKYKSLNGYVFCKSLKDIEHRSVVGRNVSL